jgi:predicted nucleic acid-binding protein
MNNCVVIDSSVLLDQFRTGRHSDRMARLDMPIRNSAVVLAELWRGATTVAERELVLELQENYPILTPSTEQWIESGQILATMRTRRGFEPAKLRDLHFDVLIALTAHSHGAWLITSNRADFEMIRKCRDFRLEVW